MSQIEKGTYYVPKFYIPTPIPGVNRDLKNGGVPSNAIMQIQSEGEGSFKTTIALQMAAIAQKMGLTAGIIDAEHAFDEFWAMDIGVDTNELYFVQPDSGDDAWNKCYELITEKGCQLIIMDSIDAMQPESVMVDGEVGDAGIGNHARLHSQGIRKLLPIMKEHDAVIIGINQRKVNLTQMGARGTNPTGGAAWKFYSKLVLISKRGSAKSNLGQKFIPLTIFVDKNKMGNSFNSYEVIAEQGYGIREEYALMEELIENKIVSKRKGWYKLDGETIANGTEQIIRWIRDNRERVDELLENNSGA